MLLNILGWGGGEVNVPCTSRHVGCYARCWVGVGGDVNVPCTCTHVGCYARCWGHFDDFLPKAIHNKSKATRLINDQIWDYLYSWQWRQNAGKDLWTNMYEVFAEWKKDAADSVLKFQRALNAGRRLVYVLVYFHPYLGKMCNSKNCCLFVFLNWALTTSKICIDCRKDVGWKQYTFRFIWCHGWTMAPQVLRHHVPTVDEPLVNPRSTFLDFDMQLASCIKCSSCVFFCIF